MATTIHIGDEDKMATRDQRPTQNGGYDPGEGPSKSPPSPYAAMTENRNLSPSEVITEILQNFGANILIHAALVKTEMAITDKVLAESLQILTRYQPALRMVIKKDTSNVANIDKMKFMELEEVNIEFATTTRFGRYSWVEIAQQELQVPFNSQVGPLWKVIYVELQEDDPTYQEILTGEASSLPGQGIFRSSTGTSIQGVQGCILFKVHHVIADHLCMYDLICGQLLTIINSVVMNRGEYLHEQFPKNTELCRSADSELLSQQHSTKKSKQGEGRYKSVPVFQGGNGHKKRGISPPVMWMESPTTGKSHQSATRMLTFHLPRSVSQRILLASRKHQVQVSTALMYALHSSLGIYNKLQEGGRKSPVSICSPVELRMFTPGMEVPLSLSRYVSHQVWQMPPVSKFPKVDAFWTGVQNLDRYYRWGKEECEAELRLHGDLLSYLTNGNSLDAAVAPFRAHAEFYYLGNVQTNKAAAELMGDPVVMTEHYFTKSHSDASFASLAITMCMMNDTFMGTISYNKKWLTRRFVSSFKDIFFDVMYRVMDPAGREQDHSGKTLPPMMRARRIQSR